MKYAVNREIFIMSRSKEDSEGNWNGIGMIFIKSIFDLINQAVVVGGRECTKLSPDMG